MQEYGTTTHASSQAFECKGRTMPMAMTSRAAPTSAASQLLGMPTKGKRWWVPPCRLPQRCYAPSAAGKDELKEWIMTFHLQTQGVNEMMIKRSAWMLPQILFKTGVSRDWDPTVSVRHLKITFAHKLRYSFMLSPKPFTGRE